MSCVTYHLRLSLVPQDSFLHVNASIPLCIEYSPKVFFSFYISYTFKITFLLTVFTIVTCYLKYFKYAGST